MCKQFCEKNGYVELVKQHSGHILIRYKEKKEEIWLSPMTKAPTPTEMSKGQSDNTNNATKKFD